MKSNQTPVSIKSDILKPQITHLNKSVDINTTTAATRLSRRTLWKCGEREIACRAGQYCNSLLLMLCTVTTMAVIVARWTDVVFTVRSATVVQETGASPRSRLQAHVVRQDVAIYCNSYPQ